MIPPKDIHQLTVDTIRYLSADAVQEANSGHPGTPMSTAAMATVLWTRFLRFNPANPGWPGRDRFVLSAGHASMLLYSLLHLTGYDLPLEEIRRFRQWGSKTPGHPEFGHTPGVEETTGPLGQGIVNAVGMAMAEKHLAAEFNRPGHEVVDHRVYVLCSDGDLQEGVSGEVTSLAGHLGLGRLICLYDDNRIQIEGPTALSFTEDVAARFRALHWHVQEGVDGEDLGAVERALDEARAQTDRPSLVLCRTVIGFPSPNQGTAKVHGESLGERELQQSKEASGWPLAPRFLVPDAVREYMRSFGARGRQPEKAWQERVARYEAAFPDLAGPGR